jgi:hypothetical protein
MLLATILGANALNDSLAVASASLSCLYLDSFH